MKQTTSTKPDVTISHKTALEALHALLDRDEMDIESVANAIDELKKVTREEEPTEQ